VELEETFQMIALCEGNSIQNSYVWLHENLKHQSFVSKISTGKTKHLMWKTCASRKIWV